MISKKPYLLRANHQWIVDSGYTPYLLVKANFPGVNVPEEFVRDGKIVLDISSTACRGLDISAEAIHFSARFSGTLLQIVLPLGSIQAIYAKENSQGETFQVEKSVEPKQSPEKTVKKPFLTVIHNEKQ